MIIIEKNDARNDMASLSISILMIFDITPLFISKFTNGLIKIAK